MKEIADNLAAYQKSQRNEAAERLLDDPSILLMFSGPEIIGLNEVELALQLDAALAAERRATVERIKNAIKEARPFTWRRVEANPSTGHSTEIELGVVVAILDEEAAR